MWSKCDPSDEHHLLEPDVILVTFGLLELRASALSAAVKAVARKNPPYPPIPTTHKTRTSQLDISTSRIVKKGQIHKKKCRTTCFEEKTTDIMRWFSFFPFSVLRIYFSLRKVCFMHGRGNLRWERWNWWIFGKFENSFQFNHKSFVRELVACLLAGKTWQNSFGERNV